MSKCNVDNRTIFLHDNLDVLENINPDCIDLIYLDPPFNKNKKFTAPIGSSAEGAEFSDIFREEDVKDEWLQAIHEDQPELHNYLNGIKGVGKRYNFAYLAYMAIRLIECHRILKPTGSIYLHCDPAMSHYLKTTLDCIFGEDNFRNEIVWRRAPAHNDPKRYGNNTDRLLYYRSSEETVWNEPTTPNSADEISKAYPSRDERGAYRNENLTGPKHGTSGGESSEPWGGYDVAGMGRVWSAPLSGHYAEWIEKNFIPKYRSIKGVHARLNALDRAGFIHHPIRGKWPGLKRYAQADRGKPLQALFTDILGFTNYNKAKEWLGYPTQKPLALLERIIEASSNKGDVVLDPFCGCATTCIAAERLERQWIGIDVSHKAYDLVKERLDNEVARPDELFGEEVYLTTKLPVRLGESVGEAKHVYIISHPKYPGEYKVGIAKNVKARLNAYQTSDPDRAYRLEFSRLTHLFRETERHVHDTFDNKHEWVSGELAAIKRAISEFSDTE